MRLTMRSPAGSRVRAALLAAAMNFGVAAPVDPFRFLRVPAVHFVMRRRAAISSRIWRREPARRRRWRR